MGTSPILEVKRALIDAKQAYADAMHAAATRALELWQVSSSDAEKESLEELRVTSVHQALQAIREYKELNKSYLESTAVN
jgi:hypothetical protein